MIKISKKLKIFLIFLISLILIILILHKLFPIPKEKLFPETSKIVYFKNGKVARIFLTSDDKLRFFLPYKKIPQEVRKIFILSEDKYFFYHPGVNPLSIARAIISNIKKGKIVSGGSTITMQIARMIEPKKRNLKSKIIEALRAIQLEFHFSKKKLLEIYLNITPYGGNVEGIGAASYIYFQKPVSALNTKEIALLALIPKSPKSFSPNKKNIENISKRYRILLKRLKKKKIINNEEFKEWIHLKGLPKRHPLPFSLPHFSDYLIIKYPKKREFKTTISFNTQKSLEKLVKNYSADLKGKGIKNISVIIINNRKKSIEAVMGSQNYFSKEEGQIRGFLTLRSPGSTLKPFLYAYALEKGLITTETLLKDIPIEYETYAPHNFKDIYRGLVPAKKALAESLNVPAVNLLNKIGVDNFYELLKRLDFRSLKDRKNYGLSIILGGCGITLYEISRAYTIFANRGILYNLKELKDDKTYKTKIFSEGTAYLITNILESHKRPDFPKIFYSVGNLPRVAWKTGTSYGHFDAWSIGYTPDYTVGVWAGNFDNTSSADIVGVKVATPLMFKIFDMLTKNGKERWFKRPSDLIEMEVCSFSGMRVISDKVKTKRVLVLKKRIPTEKCKFHKKFFIDKKTGEIVCPEAMKETGEYEEKIFLTYPPDIAYWYKKRGILIEKLPSINPLCSTENKEIPPQIIFPKNNQIFYFPEDLGKNRRRLPLVSNKIVYWFVNEVFSGKGRKIFISPSKGYYTIEAIDENSIPSKKVKIYVKN